MNSAMSVMVNLVITAITFMVIWFIMEEYKCGTTWSLLPVGILWVVNNISNFGISILAF